LTPDEGELVVDERTGDIFEVSESLRDRPAVTFVDEGSTPDLDGSRTGTRPDMMQDPPEFDFDNDGMASGADVDSDAPATGGGAATGDDQLVVEMDVDSGTGQKTVMETRQQVRQPDSDARAESQTAPEDTSLEVDAVQRPRFEFRRTEFDLLDDEMDIGMGQEFDFAQETGLSTGTVTETGIGQEFGFEQEQAISQELGFEQDVSPRQDVRQEFGFEQRQELESEQRLETRTEQRGFERQLHECGRTVSSCPTSTTTLRKSSSSGSRRSSTLQTSPASTNSCLETNRVITIRGGVQMRS